MTNCWKSYGSCQCSFYKRYPKIKIGISKKASVFFIIILFWNSSKMELYNENRFFSNKIQKKEPPWCRRNFAGSFSFHVPSQLPEQPAETVRSDLVTFPELHSEIIAVIKSAFCGNVRKRQGGGPEQFLGFCEPEIQQIIHRGKTGRLFEMPEKGCLGHVCHAGERGSVQRFIVMPLHQNLWANSGSGSSPSWWYKHTFAILSVRNPNDFLIVRFIFLFNPSTIPLLNCFFALK